MTIDLINIIINCIYRFLKDLMIKPRMQNNLMWVLE